jgi:rare lipoprotein A
MMQDHRRQGMSGRWRGLLLGAIIAGSGLAGCAVPELPLAQNEPAPIILPVEPPSLYPPDVPSYLQVGLASWYGPGFHHRPTASGERFEMDAITAAHRHLPLHTVARVTNIANGRKIIVRINDRGPYVEGRVIDLSRGAARQLGMAESGVATVRIEVFAADQRFTVAETARLY